MTADPKSIDLSTFVSERLERAEPDLLRSMLQAFVEALMGAEADAICGAPYGARSPERTNSRNGYRAREWDTRTGSVELALPKLRSFAAWEGWSVAAEARLRVGGKRHDGRVGNVLICRDGCAFVSVDRSPRLARPGRPCPARHPRQRPAAPSPGRFSHLRRRPKRWLAYPCRGVRRCRHRPPAVASREHGGRSGR